MTRGGALLAACALVAASAIAEGDARASGALEAIASQVAKGIGAPPPSAVVVTAPLVSDAQAPRGEELAGRVAQLVAGAIGGRARAHPQSATLAQARAIAANGGALVYVQPSIARGTLRVTADVYAVQSNGWDRVRDPAPPPRAHAFAQAAVDAEVRVFLPAIPLERASVHRARHDEGDVLAVACGDLDGDGGLELALVSRARVAVGHIVAGKFVTVRAAPWSALAARAGVPMREPLAGASIVVDAEHATLLAGVTDRGGVALDASLAPIGVLRGIPVAVPGGGACAAPSPESSAFDGDVVACGAEPAIGFAPPAARYDAVAALDVVSAEGRVRPVRLAREPAGKLQIRVGEAAHAIDGVGAQIALGDLDQDGAPELAASSASPDADDAVTVWTWDGVGDPHVRLHIPAPGGVRALCTCPPEESGAPALVAVVGGEVWIVR